MVRQSSLLDHLVRFGEGRSNRGQVRGYPKLGRHVPCGIFRRYQFLPCGATRPQPHSTMALALESVMPWAMLIPATLSQGPGSSETVLL